MLFDMHSLWDRGVIGALKFWVGSGGMVLPCYRVRVIVVVYTVFFVSGFEVYRLSAAGCIMRSGNYSIRVEF